MFYIKIAKIFTGTLNRYYGKYRKTSCFIRTITSYPHLRPFPTKPKNRGAKAHRAKCVVVSLYLRTYNIEKLQITYDAHSFRVLN